MLTSLDIADKKQKLLVVTADADDIESVLRAGRNIQGVSFIPSTSVEYV